MADFNSVFIKALVAHISEGIPALAQVNEEWPTPNIMMKMPSAAVTTQRCVLVPYQSSREVVGAVDEDDNTASVLRTIGHHDVQFQIDLWARSKPERATLSEAITDIINYASTPLGLRLSLPGYENQIANVLITERRYADGSNTPQSQEWRSVFTCVATCPAVRRSTDNVITSTETQFDTPKSID